VNTATTIDGRPVPPCEACQERPIPPIPRSADYVRGRSDGIREVAKVLRGYCGCEVCRKAGEIPAHERLIVLLHPERACVEIVDDSPCGRAATRYNAESKVPFCEEHGGQNPLYEL
jgi:hypothetical protein